MRKHKKKWLCDKGKTSGSRKRWSYGGDFANERNTKQFKDLEDAPKQSGMKTGKVFNNRLNFAPLRRFLNAKVGQDWNIVFPEIKERIPQDVWESHNPIEWYVHLKVKIEPDGSIVNLKAISKMHALISKDGKTTIWRQGYSTYYVHPETNLLCKLVAAARANKLPKEEGRKKFAEVKTQRNKSKSSWKKRKQEIGDEAAVVMKQKKKPKDDIQIS
jgi:hypothetical protein